MSETRKFVGTRVRELRHDAKLTQEQLGERAGLSYKFVGEVERGVANPTLDTLDRLAAALGVGLVDLIRKPYESRSVSLADYQAVQEVRESMDDLVKRFKPRKLRPRR